MSFGEFFNGLVGVIGTLAGIAGVVVALMQRSKRQKTDLITMNLIARFNGFFIAIKVAVQNDPVAILAMNDSLDAIKIAKAQLDALEKRRF